VLGDGTTLNKGADITATNLIHGQISINNGDVKFGARKDVKDVETSSKSSGFNLSVRIKSEAVDRAKQGIDSFKQIKSGDILGGIATSTNTVTGVISGLASNQGTKLPISAVNADNTVGKDNLKAAQANNNFYANVGVNLGFNKSSSNSKLHSESGVVTTIKGKDENSSITYNNVKNIEYVGTQAKDTKFIYNNVDSITKKAVELNNYSSSSSRSKGVSAGVTIGYGDGVQTEADAVKVSASQSKMNSNGTTYQNGRFVNVDEVHNNTKNMTLSGFNQEGGTVTGNIENLTIESKQNTSTTKGRTIGGSLSIAPNGMPSGSASYSQTNGERRVVDSPTTFIIGDGSNLKVGKVENTAGAIGATGSGKLSIDEYIGHNLENKDETTTKGGSLSLSPNSNVISGVGINYANKDLESITKNTVVGNVEIGKASGDEINKDLDSMTEITKDKDTKTNVFVESQTIKYALNPNQFKEDLQIAIIEGKATGRTVVKTIDNMINGDKSQDIGDAEKRSLIEIKEAIVRVQTAPAMDIIAEKDLADKNVQARLGVEIEKFDPNDPTLSEKVRERINELKAEGKEIVAFYDKKTGKIFINQNAKDDEVRASIAREYKIKEDLELGRGKENDKGQLRSTVAGEIAYDEIKDRLKKGDKNPISASSFDVAKMDKNSEVTADLADKDVEMQYFNSLPYVEAISNGAWKRNPKYLKEMRGDTGELEDYIKKPDFNLKTVHLLYAESEEGKKKIAIAAPIVDSLNKNSPDREYYKRIDGIKKEVVIESNPKAKSYGYHLKKSLSEIGNVSPHLLEAGYKFFNSDIRGAVGEGFAAVNSLFKPATLGIGSKLGDNAGRVGKGSTQYGPKEEVEWKQEFIRDSVESATDIVVTPIVMKTVGTGISKGKEIYKNYKLNNYLEELNYPAHNAANYARLKEQYRVSELANDAVDSITKTGRLPNNYITKAQAKVLGWSEGKALNNYAPGKAIGGDIYRNSTGILPMKNGRIWYEADVGINYIMSRSNLKNPGYRILYSSDGLIYGTYDHYKTVFPILP
ncbi:hemagglutinin repeat-containing protein, partial [Fusobacterium polymorphum]|uniref:hemagglutinin repeat-containing protein n=1 Tax=Fusobacterium nucleatum subsp. polymorphum TaxID=76857 RepID=UPI001C9C2647